MGERTLFPRVSKVHVQNDAIQCAKSLEPGQYFGGNTIKKFYWYFGVKWEDKLSHPLKLSKRWVWVRWHALRYCLIADTVWMKHGLWLLQSLCVLLAGDALEDIKVITRYLTTYWCNLNASSKFLIHLFHSMKTEPDWPIEKKKKQKHLTRFCWAN